MSSETKPDGGPAFPTQDSEVLGGISVGKPGMTLRDWFAGMAINGLLTDTQIPCENRTAKNCSRWAYEFADSMIAERNK